MVNAELMTQISRGVQQKLRTAAIPSHWKGDLIISGDSTSTLITLVESSSRS